MNMKQFLILSNWAILFYVMFIIMGESEGIH